ncbi:hypothetical protein HMPREF9511_02052 [Enterococcus faecalis TX0630]|uniref:Uncharacterized protein n=1 Tax=Enterococcus faecalis TX0630 TaxID=749508 RepID=A0ABC9P4J6_ENTFL|nr:predicted protein [Enterococcus faecalis JH1]EFU89935.1 hypothetical protein HMPREF9511_02052 [Enterococcus faecalis TX0630]
MYIPSFIPPDKIYHKPLRNEKVKQKNKKSETTCKKLPHFFSIDSIRQLSD